MDSFLYLQFRKEQFISTEMLCVTVAMESDIDA